MKFINNQDWSHRKYSCAAILLMVVGVILLVSSLALVALENFKRYHVNFMLGVVPDALGVHSILYRKEESWGIGPGGNETGVRVFPLEEEIAMQVRENGIRFLVSMPPNKDQDGRRGRGSYSEWQETPLKPSPHWRPNKKTGLFSVYDYLGKFGFHIEVEREVINEIDSIVNGSGSYYAYGRVGLIIVSPNQKKVVYLYNG